MLLKIVPILTLIPYLGIFWKQQSGNIMKKTAVLLLIVLSTVMAFGQSNKPSADEKAIEKLIHKEIKAYVDKDWKTYESCWLHEPYTRHFVTSKSAFNGRIGWEKLGKTTSQSFKIEGPRGSDSKKTDIQIQVFGDAAYATFKEHHWSISEEDPWKIEAINNAFFVKRDGKWKFVCMNIVNTSSYETAKKNRALVEEFLETISGNIKTEDMLTRYISAESEEVIRQNLMVEEAFPLYELTADEIMVEGNRVVAKAKFSGLQQGLFGSIEPTGNKVDLEVVLLYTIDNGQITEYSVIYDNASMLRQLGVHQ
jgi:predicted ester cyclase